MHIWCKQRSKGAGGQDVPLTHSAALPQSAFDLESLCPLRPPARSERCQAGTSGRSAEPVHKQQPEVKITCFFCIKCTLSYKKKEGKKAF